MKLLQLNFALFSADAHLKSIVMLGARISNILISMRHFFHQKNKSFCEIFKSTFFTEHLWATASVLYQVKLRKQSFRKVLYEVKFFVKDLFTKHL